MPDKVLDTSVLAAIAFGEPEAEEAKRLIAGVDLYAPPLLAYELGNVARKKVLQRPSEMDAILRAYQEILAMQVRSVEPDHMAVLHLALESGLTVYDASYLYTARVLNAEVLTFDNRLRAAARRLSP